MIAAASVTGLLIGALLPALAERLLADRRRRSGAPPRPERPASRVERVGASLATAGAFAICALERSPAELAGLLPFAAVCVLVSLTDLRERLIPDRVTCPAAAYGVLAAVAFADASAVALLASGAIAFAAMLVIVLINPGGLGMGDAKLGGLIGLYLGPEAAPAIGIAILLGVVCGIAVAIRRGVARARRTTLAFGPLLAFGALAAQVVGQAAVDGYVESIAALRPLG